MKKFLLLVAILCAVGAGAQELFVYTEPASGIPARAISAGITDHFVTNDRIYGRFAQRVMPYIKAGLGRNLTIQASATVANMHTVDFQFESYGLYARYRFLSVDDVHRHFRMAAFIDGSHTRAPFHYDEIGLMGDKSGIEVGVIATALWHKLAVSGTVSHTQLLDRSRFNDVLYIPERSYEAVSYSLSAGYLLLPRDYTDYRQVNLNVYVELIGQHTLDHAGNFIDLAPALQLIVNSNTRINLGARVQVSGNMDRMSTRTYLVGIERTLLNALAKKG